MRRAWLCLLAALLVSFGALAGGVEPAGAQAPATVLIAALEPDTYLAGEPDETIVLVNQGTEPVDLSGWTLEDSPTGACTSSEGRLAFPSGMVLSPGAFLPVTQVAGAYAADHRGPAGAEWLDDPSDPWPDDPAVPNLIRLCGRLQLSNDADEVLLRRPDGTVADAVVYGGEARSVPGWAGDPVLGLPEGWVIERDRAETATGLPLPDTDSAADFDDLRLTRIGQSHWPLETFRDVTQLRTCTSPDSSFAVVDDFVRQATSSLDISLYEWTNTHLLPAFLDALRRGVRVRVLMEGGPVGFTTSERYQQNWILSRLASAGADVRYLVTLPDQRIHARYAALHAKVALRDGRDVLVTSGNWKPTGLPTDPTYGNREWCLEVSSPSLARYLGAVLADDADISEYRDVIRFGEVLGPCNPDNPSSANPCYGPPPADFVPDESVPTGPYPPLFPSQTFSAEAVTPILSPDTSLCLEAPAALIPRIRAARSEVLVEQMTLHLHWGPAACGPSCITTRPSPLLQAVVAAARGGARVRVLVGDEFIDPDDSRNNRATVDYLNALAAAEGLDLRAKVVESSVAEIVKVHNKGVIIDGQAVYVGSMNWGAASAQENREVGLLVDSPGAASFFREVFFYDWAPTTERPLTNLRAVSVVFEPAGLLHPSTDPPAVVRGTIRLVEENPTGRGAADHVVGVTVAGAPGFSETLEVTVPDLPAYSSRVVRIPWGKPLAAGAFRLVGEVDATGVIRETDESDNRVEGSFTLFTGAVEGLWVPP